MRQVLRKGITRGLWTAALVLALPVGWRLGSLLALLVGHFLGRPGLYLDVH